MKTIKPPKTIKAAKPTKISVSELNLRKSAARLLKTPLVSTELDYLHRELGTFATQEAVDAKVLAVRSMPWSSIVVPD